jgi:hypothetical protein
MGFGAIRVCPPNEILVNKLCTLLPRAEDALRLAMQKDGGLTPAQLAWVLSQITLGEDARIPGGLAVEELRAFVGDLIARLTRLAFPEARPPNHPC